jgi:hypothetical protein
MIRQICWIGLTLVGIVVGLPQVKAFDVERATDELAQSLREDIQRQRARAQRDEAARQGVDLSEFGQLVDDPATKEAARRARRSIQCTTINLGGGDFATDCD